MFEEGDTEEAKAAKREEIDAVLRQIRGGADFAALAQEHSDCPSKANGGDLGWFGRNRMVKPFEDVAFTLPVGKVSDVVETRFGYHVIEVLQKRDAKQLPLEEVRAGIEEQLNQQHRKERIDDYLLELRGDADIVYNEPLQVAPVGGDAPPPPPQ